jgi:hypothetical protein
MVYSKQDHVECCLRRKDWLLGNIRRGAVHGQSSIWESDEKLELGSETWTIALQGISLDRPMYFCIEASMMRLAKKLTERFRSSTR